MKGTYGITVYNNVLHYQFEIRRNITIIKGDSATGKTTLVDMIREYDVNGKQSGVTLNCKKNCVVLEGRQWKVLLENMNDSIVFIDEGNKFVASDEFANAVKCSDNYFVIVTRDVLPNLPYSVEEVYGIKASGKYGTLQQTYQELYRIYGKDPKDTPFHTEVLLVEDSNAGFEFFDQIAKEKKWTSVSAGGKSNILQFLKLYRDKKVFVIADGAAFGPEMDRIVMQMKYLGNIRIFLPESFEWLILKADIVGDKLIHAILEYPSGNCSVP